MPDVVNVVAPIFLSVMIVALAVYGGYQRTRAATLREQNEDLRLRIEAAMAQILGPGVSGVPMTPPVRIGPIDVPEDREPETVERWLADE